MSISFKSNKINNMRMMYFKKSRNKRILSNKAIKKSKGIKVVKERTIMAIIIKIC